MSFLLGAFGKMDAGRRKREIQSQLMRVQRRLSTASKQISRVDQALAKAKQTDMNILNAQISQAKQNMTASLAATANPNDPTKLNDYNVGLAQITAELDNKKTMLTQQIEDHYDNLRDSQLEPLKQEEELLQTEQDSLKTQLDLADADRKACEDMEKDGAKDLAPKYTAGGN